MTEIAKTAGQRVPTLVGAANRDCRKFADPERCDIARGAADHMSFGGSVHFCVGAELARIERRIAFEHLATVLPSLQVDLDTATWRATLLFCGLTRPEAHWAGP